MKKCYDFVDTGSFLVLANYIFLQADKLDLVIFYY